MKVSLTSAAGFGLPIVWRPRLVTFAPYDTDEQKFKRVTRIVFLIWNLDFVRDYR